jgi:hypothetical protein
MAVTAAQAIANYQSNPNIAPQVVVDSAANVTAYLDGLEPLASANNIVSITLTDTGTPIFTITTTQLVNDAQALELIATPFAITATGTITVAEAQSFLNSSLLAHLTSGLTVADTSANLSSTAFPPSNVFALNLLASANKLAAVDPTDSGPITIAGIGPFGLPTFTPKLLDAFNSVSNTIYLGDGGGIHRPDTVFDNTGSHDQSWEFRELSAQ